MENPYAVFVKGEECWSVYIHVGAGRGRARRRRIVDVAHLRVSPESTSITELLAEAAYELDRPVASRWSPAQPGSASPEGTTGERSRPS